MAIMGEHGAVRTIMCAEDPEPVIVADGKFVQLASDPRFNTGDYPINCPRGTNVDPQAALGCFTCSQAAYIEWARFSNSPDSQSPPRE